MDLDMEQRDIMLDQFYNNVAYHYTVTIRANDPDRPPEHRERDECAAWTHKECVMCDWHCMTSSQKVAVLTRYNEDAELNRMVNAIPSLPAQVTSSHNVLAASLETLPAQLEYGAYWKGKMLEDIARMRGKVSELPGNPRFAADLIPRYHECLTVYILLGEHVVEHLDCQVLKKRRRLLLELSCIFHRKRTLPGLVIMNIVDHIFAGWV